MKPWCTVLALILPLLLTLTFGTPAVAVAEPGPSLATPGSSSATAGKNLLVVTIAGAFVAIYWLDRFNVPDRRKTLGQAEEERFRLPATNRSSTTASRYYSAAATYCVVGLGVYLLLVFSGEAWRQLAAIARIGAGLEPPAWLRETSSPAVVALALTVLAPKVPGFKHADAWLRRHLHHYAAIPDEVRHLSRQLRASDDPTVETHTFTPPEDARTAMRRGLEHELADEVKGGVDLNQWIVFGPEVGSRDLAYRWTKTEVLMRQVKVWIGEGSLDRFMTQHSEAVDSLHRRRGELLKRMRELMRVSQGISPTEGTGALAAYQRMLAEDARDFLHDLYDFVSAALLSRHPTRGRISEELERLGFHMKWDPLRLTIHELALTGMLGFLVMILGFLVVTVLPGTMTIQHALAISLLVGFGSAGAVFSAIVPRDKGWAIAQHRRPNRPAWAYYVVSGLMAMALQTPFCFIFRLVREEALESAWTMFVARDIGGWIWVSFVMAAGLAALVDRETPIGRDWLGSASWLMEGLIVGAGTGFTGVVIALLLGPASAPLGPVVTLLATLGAVLGAVVPSLYRDAPRTRRAALTEGMPPAPAKSELAASVTS